MKERVIKVIADNLDISPDRINPDTNLAEDLRADSLDSIEIAMALEEEFSIEIDDSEMEKIRTVGDAIAVVARNLESGEK